MKGIYSGGSGMSVVRRPRQPRKQVWGKRRSGQVVCCGCVKKLQPGDWVRPSGAGYRHLDCEQPKKG